MSHNKTLITALLVLTGSAAFLFGNPESTRITLQEWVNVRSLISEERENWAAEKDQLLVTIELLEKEKSVLLEEIEHREKESEATRNEERDLAEALEQERARSRELTEIISGYENALQRLVQRLPDPLRQNLRPLINRLPESEEQARQLGLSRRLQTVVGLLSQMDRFNNSITVESEIRQGGNGVAREVSVLYFGLASAVFADTDGDLVGLGYPAEEGWSWESANEYRETILRLMAIHRGNRPAEYVELPFALR